MASAALAASFAFSPGADASLETFDLTKCIGVETFTFAATAQKPGATLKIAPPKLADTTDPLAVLFVAVEKPHCKAFARKSSETNGALTTTVPDEVCTLPAGYAWYVVLNQLELPVAHAAFTPSCAKAEKALLGAPVYPGATPPGGGPARPS